MKIRASAAAISFASGFVAGDSCQSRFSRGVIDVLTSPSLGAVAILILALSKHVWRRRGKSVDVVRVAKRVTTAFPRINAASRVVKILHLK